LPEGGCAQGRRINPTHLALQPSGGKKGHNENLIVILNGADGCFSICGVKDLKKHNEIRYDEKPNDTYKTHKGWGVPKDNTDGDILLSLRIRELYWVIEAIFRMQGRLLHFVRSDR
jgi:hypothetical protein